MVDQTKEYLEQCILFALTQQRHGKRGASIADFLSNTEKSAKTSWVKDVPDVRVKLTRAYDKGSGTYEAVLRSFHDRDNCESKIEELLS